MADDHLELVERLYDAFNRRDPEGIVAVCDEGMEFFPFETAGAVGREAPYVGREGLREYLSDAAQVWEELLVTPSEVEQIGDQLLVQGRVYVRSRELGHPRHAHRLDLGCPRWPFRPRRSLPQPVRWQPSDSPS